MRLMFIYESLSNKQKAEIDTVIKERVKQMIVSNGGFNYSDKQFRDTIYSLVIHNETISRLLGSNSPLFFDIKERVVTSKAIEIASELERNRPKLNMIEQYIALCKELLIVPSTEALFSTEYIEDRAGTFNHSQLKKIDKKCEDSIDKNGSYIYTISSNIKSFENLVERFYHLE